MQNFVSLSGGYVVSDGFETDDEASVPFPVLGPYEDGNIKRGSLSAGQSSEVFDLGGRAQVVFLGLTGNASLYWDYTAGTQTLDNHLDFCGLPDCPDLDGLAYIINLPVCGIEHLQVRGASGCGMEYKLGIFGVPAPVQS